MASTSTRCTPHGHTHPHNHSGPTPSAQHVSELSFAEWLNITPTQLPLMSPQSVGFSPQSSGFTPTSDPRDVYMNAYSAANSDFLTSSPFSSPFAPVYPPHLTNNVHPMAHMPVRFASPALPVGVGVNTAYLHPHSHPHLQPQQPHAQPQPSHLHLSPTYTSPSSVSNGSDASLMMSLAEYYPHPQPTPPAAPTFGKDISPIRRQGESTPATTLSADETSSSPGLETPRGPEMHDAVAVCVPREDGSTATSSTSGNSAPSQLPVVQQQKPFIQRLREAADSSSSESAPGTPAAIAPTVVVSGAPAAPAQAHHPNPATKEVRGSANKEDPKSQAQPTAHPKPVEAQESPFRIAAPQPRAPYTPLDSSPLTSLAASASDVSPAIHVTASSRGSTPFARSPLHSRPSSALSTHSHGRSSRAHRKYPPRRFEPSSLRLLLPHLQLTPSMAEAALLEKERERGPLEVDADGHRYRTRSKLKSLKAEMLEREREEDLSSIRKGIRRMRRGAKADEEESVEGDDELFGVDMASPQSRLDVLAAISANKREKENKAVHPVVTRAARPKQAASPAPSKGRSSASPREKAATPVPPARSTRPKREAAIRAGQKRPYREVDSDEGETEIDTSSSGAEATPAPVARRTSKRARTSTEKAVANADELGKAKKADAGEPRSRSRVTRGVKGERISPASSPTMRSREARAEKESPKEMVVREKRLKEKEKVREATVFSELTEMEDEETASKKESSAVQEKVAESESKSVNKPAPAEKLLPIGNAPLDIPTRTFPPEIPIHSSFPLLYRQFPLCGYLDPANPKSPEAPGPLPGGHFNSPRSIGDLYTPRFVRGVGRDKAGLCPICYESKARGGASKAEWLSMKFSAFNYHMQYAHGISPTTALPFSPPVAFRLMARRPNHKNEKSELLEGKCHRCGDWAPVEGVKCVEAKLREIYWWKHAAACHKGSNIEAERGWYVEDDIAASVRAATGVAGPAGASMSKARSIMDTPQSVPFGN